MPRRAQWYAGTVIAAGALALASSLFYGFHLTGPLTFSIYLVLAICVSPVKLRLPGIEATYSLNFFFVLIGLYYFSAGETAIAGCAAVVAQSCLRTRRRPGSLQVAFNLATVSLSVACAFAVTQIAPLRAIAADRPALMAAAAFVQFSVNTFVVSGILSLLEGRPLGEICGEWYEWSFPVYLMGAALVGLLPVGGRMLHPEGWVVLLPLAYLLYFFFTLAKAPRTPGGGPKQVSAAPEMPRKGRLYVGAVLGSGAVLLACAAIAFDFSEPARFAACLALGLLASTWKVRLPGVSATISVGFVVTLFAIAELPFSQAVATAAVLALAQSLWRTERRPSGVQTAFGVFALALSVGLTHWVVRSALPAEWTEPVPVAIATATVLLFSLNTVMVSAAVCLATEKPLTRIWQNCCFWSFPYYLAGACVAGVMVATSRAAGWMPSALVLPIMGMVYVSYRLHVGKAVTGGITFVSLVQEPGA